MNPNYCHIIISEFLSLFTYEHFQFGYVYIPSPPNFTNLYKRARIPRKGGMSWIRHNVVDSFVPPPPTKNPINIEL